MPPRGRPPLKNPRAVPLRVRLTEEEARALDAARGSQTRSEFVRTLIKERTCG